MSFGIQKKLDRDFDVVLAQLPEALKAEGFGVLTEIDVKATLKKKLDVDFRRYRILVSADGGLRPPMLELTRRGVAGGIAGSNAPTRSSLSISRRRS